jgi:hypothetical protein
MRTLVVLRQKPCVKEAGKMPFADDAGQVRKQPSGVAGFWVGSTAM